MRTHVSKDLPEKKKDLEFSLRQLRKNYKELHQQVLILGDRKDTMQREVDKIPTPNIASLEEAVKSE